MSLPQMSFSGAVMVLTVAAVRALTLHRLPKKTFLVLWGVVLVRLLVPYSAPSALSVYSLAERLVPVEAMDAPLPAARVLPAALIQDAEPIGAAPVAPAVNTPTFSVDPWVAVWLIGMVACGVFFAVGYLKCRREFQKSLPVDNEVSKQWLAGHRLRRSIAIRYSDRISAPLTYGVLRPVILMPKTADWNDLDGLQYVLAHEYVHIRRFDALTKLALTAALCVHWFNPAVWMMYVLANRDMELSCDEAVVRQFGEGTKAAYAMTLIRMEETRSGLTPLYNNFSKNAIEERIVAIMKLKKTSWAAALAALALIAGVTTAFATSEQAAPPVGAERDNPAKPATDVQHITSYVDPMDGKTYYSTDNGMTWQEGDVFSATGYAYDGIDWWTVEEYEAWLKVQKEELQGIIGEKGWNPTEGWYTWDQARVDEAIAGNEQLLEEMKRGKMVSKPMADGDTMIQFGYDPTVQMSLTDTETVTGSVAVMDSISITDAAAAVGAKEPTPELLAEYQAHGLTYDEAKKAFFFNGKPVRWFADLVELEEGQWATRYVYRNDEGTEYIHTVRGRIDNGDGSYDLFGPLTGIVPWEAGERDEFGFLFQDSRMTAQTTTVVGSGDPTGTTFEERFAKYKDLGITYVEAKGVSGRGNVYWNGQLVSHFADIAPSGNAFSFTSAERGGITVQTVYGGGGQLTGVETAGQ